MNNFIKICRLCARKNIELTNMTDKESDDDISFYDMMLTCVPNLISEDDQLSTLICVDCQEQLLDTYSVMDKWHETHKVLNRYKKQMKFTIYTDNDECIHKIDNLISPSQGSEHSYVKPTDFINRIMAKDFPGKVMTTSRTNCDFKKVYSVIKANRLISYTLVDFEDPNRTVYFNANEETKLFTCLNCNKRFKSVTYLFIHLVNHKVAQKYKCKKCFSIFQHEANLKRHEDRCSVGQLMHSMPQLSIKPRNSTFDPQITTLDSEMDVSEPIVDEIVSDPIAPIVTAIDTKSGLTYNFDQSIQFFSCSICDVKIKYLFTMRRHLREHKDGKQYFCAVCHIGFKNQNSLDEHVLSHCEFYDKSLIVLRNKTGVKDYFICELCGAKMKDRCNFNQHVRRHSDERPFVCEVCGKCYKLATVLAKHKQSHSLELNNQCNLCPAKFKYRGTLVTHLQRHAGIKPYKCEVCGKAFVRKDNCKKHRKTHMNLDMPNLKCPICGITYKTGYRLRAHMFVHSSVKEFNCEICQRGFLYEHTLQFHMRKHTSVKPYNCHICRKGFLVEHRYKRHMRRHARENDKADSAKQIMPDYSKPLQIDDSDHVTSNDSNQPVAREPDRQLKADDSKQEKAGGSDPHSELDEFDRRFKVNKCNRSLPIIL